MCLHHLELCLPLTGCPCFSLQVCLGCIGSQSVGFIMEFLFPFAILFPCTSLSWALIVLIVKRYFSANLWPGEQAYATNRALYRATSLDIMSILDTAPARMQTIGMSSTKWASWESPSSRTNVGLSLYQAALALSEAEQKHEFSQPFTTGMAKAVKNI